MSKEELSKKIISGKVISDLIHQKRLSQAQVASDLKESEQVISNYAKGKRFINAEFASKWEKQYGENLIDLINESFKKSTHVDSKLTPDMKSTDSKENSSLREGVYQTIVEGHTEYVLIPRTVLNETQLVSTEQINKTWAELAEKNKELERKNKQLDFYQEQFARLMDNLELTPKPPKPKEV